MDEINAGAGGVADSDDLQCSIFQDSAGVPYQERDGESDGYGEQFYHRMEKGVAVGADEKRAAAIAIKTVTFIRKEYKIITIIFKVETFLLIIQAVSKKSY